MTEAICKRIFLLPGKLHVTSEPTIITTILGSCVSICLFDRQNKIAGMNHFLLPESSQDRTARYGNIASQALLDGMFQLGCAHHFLRAKIFGGSSVIGGPEVGKKNIQKARTWLAGERIKIIDEDVGTNLGRKIHFNTTTGQVTVNMINNTGFTGGNYVNR